MQCWVGTRIREWWPMVPTQKNCTLGHRRRAPKSTFCCPPSIGRLRAHFDGNLFCRTTKQSEDRTRECNRATHRTTWGKWGGERRWVCGLFFEKSVRFRQVKRRFKKKKTLQKRKKDIWVEGATMGAHRQGTRLTTLFCHIGRWPHPIHCQRER